VKDLAYPDTRYVTDLVAPGMVTTMPAATLETVVDHAEIPTDSITSGYDGAARVLADLPTSGVDYDNVVETLEQQGVAKFDAASDELGARLASGLSQPHEGP
jgi:transaldolase